MENNLTLTRKQVRVGLKKGWGKEIFCQRYNCSETELEERIAQLYKYQKKINEVLSELKINEKRFGQIKQQLKTRKGTLLVREDQNEDYSPEESVNGPIDAPVINNLDCLRAEEERLSREVIELENRHKEEAEKRRSRLKEMRTIKEDIERLEADLQKKCLEFQEAVEHADSLAENMNAISDERRPKVERLQEVRAEIEERMAVSIAVYDSGEIAVLEAEEFIMDDSGYEEIYAQLLSGEECSELRLKDVRVMARLLSIAKQSGRRINLVCDHPEMEEAYQKLMA